MLCQMKQVTNQLILFDLTADFRLHLISSVFLPSLVPNNLQVIKVASHDNHIIMSKDAN